MHTVQESAEHAICDLPDLSRILLVSFLYQHRPNITQFLRRIILDNDHDPARKVLEVLLGLLVERETSEISEFGHNVCKRVR